MSNSRGFERGFDYPNEGFIQKAIEEYFLQLGYLQMDENFSDFVCINLNTNEKWVVEAKGVTKDIGLDFRTGLGQLVQRMDSRNTKYAIAVPKVDKFINQCKIVKQWVRKELQIYWLIVDEDGRVRILTPDDTL